VEVGANRRLSSEHTVLTKSDFFKCAIEYSNIASLCGNKPEAMWLILLYLFHNSTLNAEVKELLKSVCG